MLKIFDSIFIGLQGYTKYLSKKCTENETITGIPASQSLNDARILCDGNPECVFIYRPMCNVSLQENTGGMYICRGKPVHENFAESNGLSCIWHKSKFIVSIFILSIISP